MPVLPGRAHFPRWSFEDRREWGYLRTAHSPPSRTVLGVIGRFSRCLGFGMCGLMRSAFNWDRPPVTCAPPSPDRAMPSAGRLAFRFTFGTRSPAVQPGLWMHTPAVRAIIQWWQQQVAGAAGAIAATGFWICSAWRRTGEDSDGRVFLHPFNGRLLSLRCGYAVKYVNPKQVMKLGGCFDNPAPILYTPAHRVFNLSRSHGVEYLNSRIT